MWVIYLQKHVTVMSQAEQFNVLVMDMVIISSSNC